jgi:hypothetical protein
MKVNPLHAASVFEALTGVRLDANETAMLARQLEHIQAQTYDVLYPEIRALELVPLIGGVDPGAKWFTFRVFDIFGDAKMTANYADDAPRVDTQGQEVTSPIKHYSDSYIYSVDDLRSSQLAMKNLAGIGMPLDVRRAQAAAKILGRKVDSNIALGEPSITGLTGFANNALVPLVTPDFGNWPAATGAMILQDLRKLESSIVTLTKDVHKPNTLAVPPSIMGILASKPASELVPNVTVLEVFLKSARYIKNVESWYALETADAGGTGPRLIAYDRSPEMLGAVVPLEFNQLPPEARNFAFIVNCEAKAGGTVWFYPKSGAYMDGCGS